MGGGLTNKVVLITGGTGSFGRTMTDYLLDRDVRELRLLSRDEDKQHRMRTDLNDDRAKFLIGDVRDQTTVDAATRGVDYIFHAAALKHVPSCDFFPMEAVRTNVVGSRNVVRSAIDNNVSRVVFLSTDKAVRPINAMGMTKALMEKVMQAAARNLGPEAETTLCCTRYGNVMYSRGSVIPRFIGQIKAGEPITVTNPDMTRFVMPLEDAVDLVEFAFTEGCQGDLFIKKAKACTIGDLATALKELFRSDVPVKIIGVRHGEKIHETLATAAELVRAQDLGSYYRIPLDDRDLNYGKYFEEGDREVSDVDDFGSATVPPMTVSEIIDVLKSIPEVQAELDGWVEAPATAG